MTVLAALLVLIASGGAASGRASETVAFLERVTFAEHIGPLVFNNCTRCHRPGEAAPFSLRSYRDTRKHARTMLRVMEEGYMPPWPPAAGDLPFQDQRRLDAREIALFRRWVETGMAEGDSSKTPPLPKFPEGWQLGSPDLIVKMDRPFVVPASGPDIYRNFVIPLGLKEDRWVTGIEMRSSAATVVHHVLYFLDSTGRGRAQADKDGQPGFAGMRFRPTGGLGGWAVGATPYKLPEGLAYSLPKGSDLVLQTHFHLSGKAEEEVLTIGLYFADKPPRRKLLNVQMPPAFGLFSNIDIPAGQANYAVTDSFTLPAAVDLVGASAHAHYLGKTIEARAVLPEGKTLKLFSIPDWDFNWQGTYLYKRFFRLPKGTVLHGTITWDNSAENPRNPSSPPIHVRWGEASTDEMGSVRLLMVAADEKDAPILESAIRQHVRKVAMMSRLRGDKIDWKALGIRPLWMERGETAPPKEKAPNSGSVRDLDGKEMTPLTVEGAKAHVLIFTTTDCPVACSYIPEINALAARFGKQGVRFYLVQVDPELTVAEARKHAAEYDLRPPVLLDSHHLLVQATGVERTPEAVVIAPGGAVVYRGRIDDLYTDLGKKRKVATRHDLDDALKGLLAGKPIPVPRTEAVGCSIPELPMKWNTDK